MALLELTGLGKNFGGLAALGGVDLTVEPGEILGLIGPNGAGKTTLFNVISGVLPPSAGRIVYDGTDITRWSLLFSDIALEGSATSEMTGWAERRPGVARL